MYYNYFAIILIKLKNIKLFKIVYRNSQIPLLPFFSTHLQFVVRVETTVNMDVKNKFLNIKNEKKMREGGERVKKKKIFENKIIKKFKKKFTFYIFKFFICKFILFISFSNAICVINLLQDVVFICLCKFCFFVYLLLHILHI